MIWKTQVGIDESVSLKYPPLDHIYVIIMGRQRYGDLNEAESGIIQWDNSRRMYWKAMGYIANNMTWKLRGDSYTTHDNAQYEMRMGCY